MDKMASKVEYKEIWLMSVLSLYKDRTMKDQVSLKICNSQGKQLAGSIPLWLYITCVVSHSLQIAT